MTTERQDQQETMDELTPGMTGRWLVVTQGSEHTWDLDEMTYERRPGPESRGGAFAYDGEAQPITRVDAWPRVGSSAYVWFDDPAEPMMTEQYRISSAIRSITRLPDVE